MVRQISDLLGKELTFRGKTYGPVAHDVMFDQNQIALAARVVAFVMASPAVPQNERLAGALERVGAVGFVGSPTEDWRAVLRALARSDADELKRTGDHARYLRLLRRGSAIEERLAELWRHRGNYEGAEAALDEAILQDQLIDNHREASHISVMTMHQLKGREYDSVLLVEDQHRSFRGRESHPPYMETRRLLQVSLTRARHFAYILSGTRNATLNVILAD